MDLWDWIEKFNQKNNARMVLSNIEDFPRLVVMLKDYQQFDSAQRMQEWYDDFMLDIEDEFNAEPYMVES